MIPSVPRCDQPGCGRRINYNPKAQANWERAGRQGTVPGAGWHHAEDLYTAHLPDEQRQMSFDKNHPNFHYVVPPPGVTPEAEMVRKQAERDQAKAHIERHLSRQFDFLAAEKRGGKHIDLAD